MKVSIIVPVYNVENYVEECFQSIARQTYTGAMECIFVDDCGTDRSVALVEEMIAAYRGPIAFKMLHHERNRGLSAARNTGLREASGDYVYFIDSDDSITPECIALLSALAKKYPGVDMVQGSTYCEHNGFRLNEKLLPEYNSNKRWIGKQFLSRRLPITAWNRLVRRDFLLKNGLIFEEGVIHEDELWTFLLAKHLQSIAFCFVDTYMYRSNPLGIMFSVIEDTHSTLPIIHIMVSDLKGSLIFCQLKYIMGIIPNELYDNSAFLQEFGKYKSFVLKRHHIMQLCRRTAKWSLRGFCARVNLVLLPFFYALKLMDKQ